MAPANNADRSGTPPSEIKIDQELVHSLLMDQHADLAHLPFYFEQEGWDNVIFRLGNELAIRLPRRQAAADLVTNEQRWLPSLAPHLPLAVPVPYRVGLPARDYPWRWSILPWFPGVPADMENPSPDQAPVFAAFLKALHIAAPSDAPFNPVRGIPLQQRAPIIEQRLQRLGSTTDLITKKIRQQWNKSIHTPIDTERTWIHGDLHARNLLVHEGRITAVIDWGDITAGDLSTDLASIWLLFPDRETRRALISSFNHLSEATWHRARGWAILFAVLLLDTGLVNDPRNAEIGRKTLQRLLEDE